MADMGASGAWSDPKAVYAEDYFRGSEYADYLRDRPLFDRQFHDRLRAMKRYQSSGDLIEIGCAYGFFLAVAQKEYSVIGFDIAGGPVAYAREHLGVDARCEDFLSASLEPETVDVVVMWDTIEHLPRPDLTLQKVARVLRPGGFLLLTTGDIGSVLAAVRRGKWRLIHPPTHLHYFSRRTIARLLSSVGLRPVETTYVGVRRSLRQIAHSLLLSGSRRPCQLYRLIAESRLGDFSLVLNTFDIMLVVADKT
jgi:SAM-dependent methyltransferase